MRPATSRLAATPPILRSSAILCRAFVVCRAAVATMPPSPPPVDPRAICERYTDETYAKMRDDSERTSAYTAAIERVASGRVCLDVGTGGARNHASISRALAALSSSP